MHTYICVHTYIRTYMHACIHTYIHTFTYTYTYTYSHTCLNWHPCTSQPEALQPDTTVAAEFKRMVPLHDGQVCTHIYICIHIYIFTYMYTYTVFDVWKSHVSHEWNTSPWMSHVTHERISHKHEACHPLHTIKIIPDSDITGPYS